MQASRAPLVRVYSSLPAGYAESRELSLALTMFREGLARNTVVELIDAVSLSHRSLGERVRRDLADAVVGDYLLFVREPAVVFGEGSVEAMVRVLQELPQVKAVLPSDLRDHARGNGPPYLTLSGFEGLARKLAADGPSTTPYDRRRPLAALMRADEVRNLTLPDEPLDVLAIVAEHAVICLNALVHSFAEYYTESRPELVAMVPDDVTSVLDIGCAAGEFGAALKAVRNCRVVGLEQNQSAAVRAQQRLDMVISGDTLATPVDGHFDCVTCLDVLEHLDAPERLLERIRDEFLRERGYLLVSVPNIGHWSIVADLLRGRWDYVPAGILCNTHLRFYTLRTLMRLLTQHGFEVLQVVPVAAPMPNHVREHLSAFAGGGWQVDLQSLEALSYHILSRKAVSAAPRGAGG